jgi:Ca2+-binding EF-hand superfamily protein
MISRDKAFPVAPYQVPRNKTIKVINLQGCATTSQIPVGIQEAARSPRGKRTPRSARGAPSAQVVRSPQPKEEVKESVGEILRNGSSAVRLHRALHDMVGACPACSTVDQAQATVSDLEKQFADRCSNDYGMLDADDFHDGIQAVFTPFGEPVERRRITRLFNVLDAASSGLVDYKLMLVGLIKVMSTDAVPLAARVALLHRLYGDDIDGTGVHDSSVLQWVNEQELEYADYARQIMDRLDGSKQANMLTWAEINVANKRSPLLLRSLHRAFSLRLDVKVLLDLLAKQAHTATATPAALMLAQMQGGEEKIFFDWPKMHALWGALKARIDKTKRVTLPRDEFVAEVTKQQGGSDLPERQETLKALFAIADPDDAGIVDARDCCAVLCRGVTNGNEHKAAGIESNILQRLEFFRSMYEMPIGASGPNGPSIAVDRLHYVKILDRSLDEQRLALDEAYSGLQAVRSLEGRLDAKYILERVKAEPKFGAVLSGML